MDPSHIRNFAIIAHIDHGKSTLSDRLLELTGSLTAREIQAQVLDAMDIERTKEMIEKSVGLPADDAIAVSAKTGLNVAEILEAVVTLLPPPEGNPDAPLQALIFDSWFDPYRGVIVLARIINGKLRQGMKIKVMSNGT